jgi:hypothetical protein
MARRARNSFREPESLGAILDRAGENRFARIRPPIARRVWYEAVGARIAERAQPISLTTGVLLLRVATSVWAHELSLLSDVLCLRLRERGIHVRELRFHVGAIAALDRPPERRRARVVPVAQTIPPALARFVAEINDPPLREAIARAAATNLAWQSVVRAPPPRTESSLNEAQRGARAPRSAGPESARPAQTSTASRAEGRRTPAGGPDRRR